MSGFRIAAPARIIVRQQRSKLEIDGEAEVSLLLWVDRPPRIGIKRGRHGNKRRGRGS